MFVRLISYRVLSGKDGDAIRLGKRLAECTSQACGGHGTVNLCKATDANEYVVLAMWPGKTPEEAEAASVAFEDIARSDMSMVAERVVKTYEVVDWKAMAES